MQEWIAQGFGIIGLLIIVYSFQCKENKNFFWMQGLGSLCFTMNFLLLVPAGYAGALYNLVNLIRGLLFSKDDKKVWKLALVEALYVLCYAFSLYLFWGDWFAIVVAALPWLALLIMSVLMWRGNGAHIRMFQVSLMSPAWIVHNVINFTLGGILCESFNMISVIVSFIRYGKDDFNKA